MKLQQSWYGPFIVYKVHGETNAFLKRLSAGKYIQKSVSVLRLKRALLREDISLWTDLNSDNLPDTDLDITDVLDDHAMKTVDSVPMNDNTNTTDEVQTPHNSQTDGNTVTDPDDDVSQDRQVVLPKTGRKGRPRKNTDQNEKDKHNKTRTKCKSAFDSVSDQYYEIERFRGKRVMDDGSVKYLCKWKGYSDQFSSWEPFEALNAKAKKIVQSKDVPFI